MGVLIPNKLFTGKCRFDSGLFFARPGKCTNIPVVKKIIP